jgi:DNA-binding NarL/FixJ family response regulator
MGDSSRFGSYPSTGMPLSVRPTFSFRHQVEPRRLRTQHPNKAPTISDLAAASDKKALMGDAMAKHSAKTSALAKSLSTREYEILRMLTHGYDLPEIGERLGVCSKTVANHQSSIKQKRGASSALQLIIIARQMGLN